MSTETDLQRLRERIDTIDRRLLDLVSERARCAQSVAEVKQQALSSGADPASVVYYRPEREAQVLRRIMTANPGPLPDEEVARLFREIMSACLALERPLTIAFSGVEGDFAQAAALKHFGHSVIARPHPGVEDVFREVESGQAHYGVVPVESSREGVLGPTLDVFLGSSLQICGEVQLRSRHQLLGQQHELEKVRTIYAMPWVFSSCRMWLDENAGGIERVSVGSYTEGLERVRQAQDAAVIAGGHCVGLYALRTLAAAIEDHPEQTARYLVLGAQSAAPSGRDKTSFVVSARNEPGSLYRLLEPLNRHGLSLTRIDSRPSVEGDIRGHFFIDVLGHAENPELQAALAELSELVLDLRILGSFPEAVL